MLKNRTLPFLRIALLLLGLGLFPITTIFQKEYFFNVEYSFVFKALLLGNIALFLLGYLAAVVFFGIRPPQNRLRRWLTFLLLVLMMAGLAFRGLELLGDKHQELYYSFSILGWLAISSPILWYLQYGGKDENLLDYTLFCRFAGWFKKNLIPFSPSLLLGFSLLGLAWYSTLPLFFALLVFFLFVLFTHLLYFLPFFLRFLLYGVFLIGGALMLSYGISHAIQGTGFNVTFLYHLRPDVLLGDIEMGLLVIFWVFLFVFLIFWTLFRYRKHRLEGFLSLIFGVKNLLFLLLAFFSLRLIVINSALFNEKIVKIPIEKIEKIAQKAGRPVSHLRVEKKYNLIHIYIESISRTHLTEASYATANVRLRELEQRSLVFRRVKQTPYTGWSIAGLVSSQSGFPLLERKGKEDSQWQGLGQGSFMKKGYTLGDVFHDLGYRSEYICGASANFSGTNNFLLSHHTDSIFERADFEKEYDKSFFTSWGAEDGIVFEKVYARFLALSSLGRPFVLSTKNLSTHGRGFLENKYSFDGPSKLAPLAYTDALIGDLVDKVRTGPYSDNTIFLIQSDHLAHSLAGKGELIVMINLPEEIKEEIDFYGTHMDIPATLLAAMGISYEGSMGLGSDIRKGDSELLQVLYADELGEYVHEDLMIRLNSLYKSPFRTVYQSLW